MKPIDTDFLFSSYIFFWPCRLRRRHDVNQYIAQTADAAADQSKSATIESREWAAIV